MKILVFLFAAISSVFTSFWEVYRYMCLNLQPAVESFFLVHATAAEEHRLACDGRDSRNVQEQRTRENPAPPEVAIIQPDVAPASDSEGNSTTQPSPVCLNFNWEVTPSPVTLPPDQQKFLKFAGLFSGECDL